MPPFQHHTTNRLLKDPKASCSDLFFYKDKNQTFSVVQNLFVSRAWLPWSNCSSSFFIVTFCLCRVPGMEIYITEVCYLLRLTFAVITPIFYLLLAVWTSISLCGKLLFCCAYWGKTLCQHSFSCSWLKLRLPEWQTSTLLPDLPLKGKKWAWNSWLAIDYRIADHLESCF